MELPLLIEGPLLPEWRLAGDINRISTTPGTSPVAPQGGEINSSSSTPTVGETNVCQALETTMVTEQVEQPPSIQMKTPLLIESPHFPECGLGSDIDRTSTTPGASPVALSGGKSNASSSDAKVWQTKVCQALETALASEIEDGTIPSQSPCKVAQSQNSPCGVADCSAAPIHQAQFITPPVTPRRRVGVEVKGPKASKGQCKAGAPRASKQSTTPRTPRSPPSTTIRLRDLETCDKLKAKPSCDAVPERVHVERQRSVSRAQSPKPKASPSIARQTPSRSFSSPSSKGNRDKAIRPKATPSHRAAAAVKVPVRPTLTTTESLRFEKVEKVGDVPVGTITLY